ncbi:MAG: hypothetical protein MPJ50_01560 [Pirellulales bacterium]|nr:hypothetical protein [Pirellulales bacterium]
MPTQLKTLVVAATTCTLVGLIVTYTVGQSGKNGAGEDKSRPKWKSEDASPRRVSQKDEPTSGPLTPFESAQFWSAEMGAAPRNLAASVGEEKFAQQQTATGDGLPGPINQLGMAAVGSSTAGSKQLSHQASEFLTTLQALESRLQRLGASYYRLESSEDGLSFRFHCEMPLTERPGFHRFFEADSASPEESMEQVINAVEHWLAQRSAND